MTTAGGRDPAEWPLGKMLKSQRKQLGLTLDEVAKRASVGRATVSYYESGYRADIKADVNPSVKILRPLAEALELKLDDVLVAAGLSPAPQKSDEEVAAEVAARSANLADNIALLSPRFRAAVETLVFEYLALQSATAGTAATQLGPIEYRTAETAYGPEVTPDAPTVANGKRRK
ncbi:helix-turn-helix transcriptional regulator [Streptomyces sp. ID05-26A]|nr:helix-turn-helix transcriptional regulator [Streptomyces sp. ID05-26A]